MLPCKSLNPSGARRALSSPSPPGLGLDSIGYSELRILCERKFNITIPDEEATHANVPTIGALIDLILRHG